MRFSRWEKRRFRVGLMEDCKIPGGMGWMDPSFLRRVLGGLRVIEGAGNSQIPSECCPFLGTVSGGDLGKLKPIRLFQWLHPRCARKKRWIGKLRPCIPFFLPSPEVYLGMGIPWFPLPWKSQPKYPCVASSSSSFTQNWVGKALERSWNGMCSQRSCLIPVGIIQVDLVLPGWMGVQDF